MGGQRGHRISTDLIESVPEMIANIDANYEHVRCQYDTFWRNVCGMRYRIDNAADGDGPFVAGKTAGVSVVDMIEPMLPFLIFAAIPVFLPLNSSL
jgi:hypothetical protein